jgi:3',5'-cyclic AMP phosphodiesterase CpdA
MNKTIDYLCEAGGQRARRKFLKVALLCVAAAALSSCRLIPGKSSGPQPFTFAQICDTQLGMGGYEHDLKTFQQAVLQINALNPDFVVICGDLVGSADRKSFADFNRIKADFKMPCYYVPGNHDVGNAPTLESLRAYREIMGKDYYSFEHKGYVFVCVNTSLWKAPVAEESEKHDSWFEETLNSAAKKGSRSFVVGHYPLFVKKLDEAEGYGNLPAAKREKLLRLFAEKGVVAMLTGHAHRVIVNEHTGIQLVTGQATSKTYGSSLGFRLWRVTEPRPYEHDSVPLEGF